MDKDKTDLTQETTVINSERQNTITGENLTNTATHPQILKEKKFRLHKLNVHFATKAPRSFLKRGIGFIWFAYRHKIKLCFFIVILMLLIVFCTVGFTQLLKYNSQDNHITYLDTKMFGDKLVTAKVTPTFNSSITVKNDNDQPSIIKKMIEEYQKASSHNSTTYFVFCAKNDDYMPYFFNIDQSEWKYFRWFDLGKWWMNHWKNHGPVEQLAKTYFDSKNNYQHIYDFNYDVNDKSTFSQNAIANINTITTIIGANPSIKTKHQNNIDLSGWEFNGNQITRKVLSNQQLSSDETEVNSKWYNDLSAGPIIIKMIGSNDGNVEIHLCNALLNIGQLSAL